MYSSKKNRNNKKIRVVSFGASVDHNFGGPCLLAGLSHLLDNNYFESLVHYQSNKPCEKSYEYIKFQLRPVWINPKKILIGALIYKILGSSLLGKECNCLLKELKNADLVLDLWGIEFEERLLGSRSGGVFRALVEVLDRYPIAVAARILGTPVVKSTSSFGPMKSTFSKRCAYIYARFVTNKILARENSGKVALRNVGINKKILVCPDSGLAFHLDSFLQDEVAPIGISVSYRLNINWCSKISYLECMVALVKHLTTLTERKILIIPNELLVGGGEDDLSIAMSLKSRLDENKIDVSVVDVRLKTFVELKKIIAGCEVLIGSRYHSCVAALSSSVPVFVISWHDKYNELLKHYEQEKWQFSCDEVTVDKLLKEIDSFWNSRELIKGTIERRQTVVRKRLDKGIEFLFENLMP